MSGELIDELMSIIRRNLEERNLSQSNKAFMEMIQHPLPFDHSTPGKYCDASPTNHGETRWQRQLYEEETIWYDLELPIGQSRNPETGYWKSRRIDLLGFRDGRYVVCELKRTEKPGRPFDALLQLLAYHEMLQQNACVLDAMNIHHTNARNRDFRWQEVAANPILMLRGNEAYWDNWELPTGKNLAAREMIAILGSRGITIELYRENEPLTCR